MSVVSSPEFVMRPRLRSRLGTEFGDVLERLIRQIPGALAAVVSDGDGDAIDFAHDPGETREIDVELLGAQLGQVVRRTHLTGAQHEMPRPIILLEATRRTFMTALVTPPYLVALLLRRRANVAVALTALEDARGQLETLLR
jgi:hypothetical protein